ATAPVSQPEATEKDQAATRYRTRDQGGIGLGPGAVRAGVGKRAAGRAYAARSAHTSPTTGGGRLVSQYRRRQQQAGGAHRKQSRDDDLRSHFFVSTPRI